MATVQQIKEQIKNDEVFYLGGQKMSKTKKLFYDILDLINGAFGSPSTYKFKGVNFTDATHLNSSKIAGKSVGIFLNGQNRYLNDDEWVATSTGINITAAGFDSATIDYDIYITLLG